MSKNYYKEDFTQRRFNRLVAIRKVLGKKSKWLCRCDCGNYKEVYAYQLITGKTKSCGCLEKENLEKISKSNYKHGMTDTILYSKWCSMKFRCYNPKYKYYSRYGGRGIKVCDAWLGEHGFENFAKWAYANGYDENIKGYAQSIDRINTDGDYEPQNCKWSNQIEQVKNRSNSIVITDEDGEKLTPHQFDLKHRITADMFTYRRVKKGKSATEILCEWNEFLKYSNGDYYTVKEASEYYNVCSETIKKWIGKNLLTAYYVRNQYYIPKGQPLPIQQDKKSRSEPINCNKLVGSFFM